MGNLVKIPVFTHDPELIHLYHIALHKQNRFETCKIPRYELTFSIAVDIFNCSIFGV